MPDQSSAATEHAILQEITRPLEELPDDPLSVVNADFPTALRGYDRVAVDDYVLRTRQLVAELQATRSPESAVRRALERVGEEITGILQRAHETAEQITAQSRSEAEDRLEHARMEAAQIAGAAEQRVRDLDADTDRIWLERQRIVADAEELAGQLLALAKTAAERFPADAAAAAETAPAGAYDQDEAPADEDATAAFPRPPLPASGAGDAGPADDEALDEDDFAQDDFAQDDVARDDLAQDDVARDDVEETVAFPEGAEAAGEPHPSSEDPTAERPARPDDDATTVIPPASQAANRRLSQ